MFYQLPKKIQLESSQAKWLLDTRESVLVICGSDELRQFKGWEKSILFEHIHQVVKKAKSLEIPVIHLDFENSMNGMLLLGEQLSIRKQLIIVGAITAQTKQLIAYVSSVTEQICIINDAICLNNLEQHIQWIASISQQKWLHISSYTLIRLWTLSAPKELILSSKGILLAIAEQLDLEPLEIDPTVNLQLLGLDSVAMVSLIGLWRANGAEITYEDFLEKNTLVKLLSYLSKSEFSIN